MSILRFWGSLVPLATATFGTGALAVIGAVGCGDDRRSDNADASMTDVDGARAADASSATDGGTSIPDGASEGAVEGDAASNEGGTPGVESRFDWDYVIATQQFDVALGLDVGADGHSYVIGFVGDPFDFGGGEREAAYFVLHLDEEGHYEWDYFVRSARHQDIAVDGMGRVYLVGRTNFSGIDFGNGEGVPSNQNYVLALTAEGAFRWVYTYDVRQDERAAIAVDSGGQVYVTGSIVDDGDFGGGVREGPAEYTLALTADGAYRWVNTYGSHRGGLHRDIEVDAAGNIYQVFTYGGTVDFGGGDRDFRDAVAILLSLDSDGHYRWDEPVPGGRPVALAVQPNGNVFYATELYDPWDYGGGERTRVGAGDGIVVAYDTDGHYRWDHQSSIPDGDHYRDVGVDTAGNVYIVGDYLNPTSVGGDELPNFGLSDLYLISLSPEGHYQWDFPYGGERSELGATFVHGGGPGRVIVAGTFASDANFGGGLRDALRDSVYVYSWVAM